MKPAQGGGGSGKRGRLPEWNDFVLPLPRGMAAHIDKRPTDADNVGLWLDKLIHRRRGDFSLEEKYRSFSLGQFCKKWRSQMGRDAQARLEETVKAVHPRPKQRRRLVARLEGRLMVDHGRAAASETSVSFHPMWGVPKIPGSALKGVTRAEMLLDGAPMNEVEALFGREDGAGRVIFYDALPVNGAFELALDVLTPHHHDYYEGKGAPADWDSPVPVTFLTVVNTTFDLWIGARSARDEGALERAAEALTQALEESGVGGKTAAGYGRFEVTRSAP